MKLHVAPSLSLPLNAVTQKLAMLGRTGSGKTYAATKLAEEMHDAGAQIVALDPVGVWYGLRLAANGRDAGIAIPVFGGLHGDVPLEPSAGALMADLIVDRGISAICDLSQFEHDTDKARFGRDFAARFFFRKKSAPSAVHLFLEECQELLPERPQKGEEHMLHAFTRMWKLGRNFGIGGTLVSQRPQEVSKKALNLTECVFAFQLTGPHERKALGSWIEEKGLDEDIDALLPKLNVGEARVWSPGWLKISETVKISQKRTFNASSTPEVGSSAKVRTLAPIDLERIRVDMAATIEKAKATDPKELGKKLAERERKIAELERKLAEKGKVAPAVIDPEFETRIRKEAARSVHLHYASLIADILQARNGVRLAGDLFDSAVECLRTGAGFVGVITEPTLYKPSVSSRPAIPAPIVKRPPRPPANTGTNGHVELGDSGLRRMLIALAQRPGLSAKQLGVRAGLSSSSGTFGTYLGKLRSSGWITGDRNRLEITAAGITALGSYDPLPTGRDLLEYWLRTEFGDSGAGRMLRALVDRGPMNAEQLGQAADVSPTSGTFGTYLGKLRTLELVTGSRGELRASEELFE